jgi:putative DNA primase/helicase
MRIGATVGEKGPASASTPNCYVPDDLTERDQWLLWRYESRNGKPTKVPYQLTGKAADITNPRTWAPFEEVRNKWRRNPQQYAGLGFVFSKEDPFAGIDLDDSLDEQGHPKAWACGIVERFGDTYSEISPSGQGLKIWARGALPSNLAGVPVADGAIELYDHARYFAVTGRAFRGAPLQIEEHQGDLVVLYQHLTAARKGWPVQPLPGGYIPYGLGAWQE